jgi:hypothetical protein
MNEQLLRERLLAATDDVHGGPDLAVAIRAGRRRRRTTRGAVAAAVVVVAVAGATVPGLVDQPPPQRAASVPAIDTSDTADRLEASVSEHLPSLRTLVGARHVADRWVLDYGSVTVTVAVAGATLTCAACSSETVGDDVVYRRGADTWVRHRDGSWASVTSPSAGDLDPARVSELLRDPAFRY